MSGCILDHILYRNLTMPSTATTSQKLVQGRRYGQLSPPILSESDRDRPTLMSGLADSVQDHAQPENEKLFAIDPP